MKKLILPLLAALLLSSCIGVTVNTSAGLSNPGQGTWSHRVSLRATSAASPTWRISSTGGSLAGAYYGTGWNQNNTQVYVSKTQRCTSGTITVTGTITIVDPAGNSATTSVKATEPAYCG
jgi:hypothetical protein